MKSINSIAFKSPQFAVLSETQLQDLHSGALEVLRRTGIRFHHQEALEMLREAGALISDGNLVRFPARLVEDAIASTPGRIIMCDRDGEAAVFLEGTKVYFGTGSDCLNLLDPETGKQPSGGDRKDVRGPAQHPLCHVHRPARRRGPGADLRRADGPDAGAHGQAPRLCDQR